MNAVLAEAPAVAQPRIPFGIHLDLAPDVYYQRVMGEANNSSLTIIDERSPAHYLHFIAHPEDDEDSEALEFGKLLHCLVLEPERFADTYVVVPPTAPKDLRRFRDAKNAKDETKAAIAWWDDFTAKNTGRPTADDKDVQKATDMAASLRRYELEINGEFYLGGDILDACEKEVTLSWQDEDTGLFCKARADLWLPDAGFAADLKSTHNAGPSAFGHSIIRYRYHVQTVHYQAGFDACGHPLRTFCMFPIEKKAPYVAASWQIGAVSQETGWRIRQRSMRKLAACVNSNKFPGYTAKVEPIEIHAYGHFDADKD